MLARWLGLAALAAAAVALAGCAGVGTSTATEPIGDQLAIYSSLPLQGPTAALSQQMVDGEKLALAQAGGHVGPFKIAYVSLDDASPTTGQWNTGLTSTDAKDAAQDTSTIAYLGDYNSAATAISLPLINGAGILQVSPGSPYVGLTSSLDAGQDEPERFYPTGKRTFGRLQPGDPVQAGAQVQLMRSLKVRRVFVLDDQDPFEVPLADITAADATKAGIAVAGRESLSISAGATYTGIVEKIVESGAQAVTLAGGGSAGTVALWRALHSADPGLLLLGTSSMDSESFTSQLGSAGASTYLTTPTLPVRLYPPPARRVLGAYRRTFGAEGGAYALIGYETMSVVLNAIRRAGSHGNDRQAVIERFLATRNRSSVLGRYSIEADGDTTLSRYGVERVQGGQPVFLRAIEVAGASTGSG